MATLGCIQVKMGRTTYYICKMAAGELIDKVGIAKELPEWPDMTAEEKCNENAISNESLKRLFRMSRMTQTASSLASSWISTLALMKSVLSHSQKS